MKEIYIFPGVFLLVLLSAHADPGCNKTLSLTDETLVTDLNETCSWTVKSPAKTNIVVQVSVLHLTDPRDSMLLLDKTALIASYTEMDKSGDLYVSSSNLLHIETIYNSQGQLPRNVTVSLRPQVNGGRYTQSGQVKLNATIIPKNDSNPVYFQLVASPGQQVQILVNESNIFPTTTIAFYEGLQPILENLLIRQGTYNQFFPITSRSESMLIVGENFQNQEFFSGYFISVPKGCDQILTSPTTSFQLLRRNIDTQCSLVAVPQNTGFTSLKIQSLNLCKNETVTIFDGHSQLDERIATLTNKSSQTTPQIYVRADKGFRIHMDSIYAECANETVEPVALSGVYTSKSDCGKKLTSPGGTLTSPAYPDLYPLNANCKWDLPVPENGSSLVYVAMETAALVSNHALSLQDGTGKILWKFMGSKLPTTDAVVPLNKTESEVAMLVFDSSTTGQGLDKVSKGFSATYKVLKCGGYMTSENGSFSVPEGIPKGESCIWIISIPSSGTNNSTNIVQFTLSGLPKSQNSNIIVLDGGTSKSKAFDFTSKTSMSYLTRTNALWVQITTPAKLTLNYKTYGCSKKDLCKNGVCLHPNWRCNGVDNCGDMTDEQNCSSSSSPSKGLKTYLVVIIALMCFAFGVVFTIVIPAVYKRCRYPNYHHLQDLMEPSVS
ncbi:cubilin-like isoform X2 [Ostrea edulis]|uniref:cubilin-like isoform X2 n=1 Tax=Ostrea edulis TaxID=37623 RepID=UPI0024AEF9A6|nr:cubilin-like isoform X2 [Ostrea edulis]